MEQLLKYPSELFGKKEKIKFVKPKTCYIFVPTNSTSI